MLWRETCNANATAAGGTRRRVYQGHDADEGTKETKWEKMNINV